MAYHCNEPGWFRVTFTIARDDLLVSPSCYREQVLDETLVDP